MKLQDLIDYGFTFAGTIEHVRRSELADIPESPGVYAIARLSSEAPLFRSETTAGTLSRGNPTVAVTRLEHHWVAGAQVLYIGKADQRRNGKALRTRLKEYLAFGEGSNNPHWGGRFIWQLADANDLIVAWCLHDAPRSREKELIREFKTVNGSMRPFANLRD